MKEETTEHCLKWTRRPIHICTCATRLVFFERYRPTRGEQHSPLAMRHDYANSSLKPQWQCRSCHLHANTAIRGNHMRMASLSGYTNVERSGPSSEIVWRSRRNGNGNGKVYLLLGQGERNSRSLCIERAIFPREKLLRMARRLLCLYVGKCSS